MINLAILASGSGTNAENIVSYFKRHKHIKIKLVASNKKEAFVLERVKKTGVPTISFSKTELNDGRLLSLFIKTNIEFIVLAGFLLKIPNMLIEKFKNKIINIHPSLLPKFGGIGMYGDNVHNAVLESGEQQTGITIHLVDDVYDNGKIIFQKMLSINKNETIKSLASNIRAMEHQYYPEKIENYVFEYLRLHKGSYV